MKVTRTRLRELRRARLAERLDNLMVELRAARYEFRQLEQMDEDDETPPPAAGHLRLVRSAEAA